MHTREIDALRSQIADHEQTVTRLKTRLRELQYKDLLEKYGLTAGEEITYEGRRLKIDWVSEYATLRGILIRKDGTVSDRVYYIYNPEKIERT